MNFIEEVKWRGMIHDVMPGTDEQLQKEMTTAYVGIDPTADSLHIGHLVSVMLLKHFQCAGHKPLALIGGATGMIGDPSGKSEERNLLDEKTLKYNQEQIKKQLAKFLDFESKAENAAEIVNNYDWMKEFSFLDFIRDIGKHLTVNYMMAKDSVKKRLEKDGVGMSFTEFSYQLVQGYDFLHLFQHKNCKLQMGGSDQWGNITTGSDLIRKKTGGEAFALTCPLITKADGSKFGKTEKGNIWLDPEKTSPYEFYQFWMNTSDDDAKRFIKIFTMLKHTEIENIIETHQQTLHERLLQRTLAKEMTIAAHSEADFNLAVEASQILFGKGTAELLASLDEKTFRTIFEGVPQFNLALNDLINGITTSDLLAIKTNIFSSKSELRRTISGGGLSINKNKIDDTEFIINADYLINNKYLLVQKGKKNYFVISVE